MAANHNVGHVKVQMRIM